MYAAVRVRGQPDRSNKVDKTIELLGLDNRNKVVFLPETETFEGMLEKVKDVVTYGQVSEDYLEEFLEERTDIDEVFENLDVGSVEELVEKLDEGELNLSDAVDQGFENLFRLNSPKKGFKDTKRQFKQSGSLGFREGNEIETLLKRM